MSLICSIERFVSVSICCKQLISASIGASNSIKLAAKAPLPVTAFLYQFMLFSLPLKCVINCFFGILHCSTQILIITRSCDLTRSIMLLILLTRISNCLPTNLNCLKTSDKFSISCCAFLWARPYFFIAAEVLSCCSLSSENFALATSGSIETSSSAEESPSSSLSSSLSSISISDSLSSNSSGSSSDASSALGSTKPVIRSDKRTSPLSTKLYCSKR